MKNLVLSLLIIFTLSCDQAPDHHTSQNSLDWDGAYINDSELLVLNQDFTYTRTLERNGEKKTSTGKFSFDKSGLIIQIDQTEEYFQVQENQLKKMVSKNSKSETETILKELTLRTQPWALTEAKDLSLKGMERPAMIELTETEMSGFGGCNRLRGEMKINEASGEISFSGLGSSKMFCPDSGIEQRIMQYLNQTKSYQMLDGKLILKDEEGTTLLIFEPAVSAKTIITETVTL